MSNLESAPLRFPWWWRGTGLVLVLLTSVLAARLVWEQAWLTWQSGPQMVGFALAHGGGIFLILAPVLLLLWLTIVVVTILWSLVRRRHACP